MTSMIPGKIYKIDTYNPANAVLWIFEHPLTEILNRDFLETLTKKNWNSHHIGFCNLGPTPEDYENMDISIDQIKISYDDILIYVANIDEFFIFFYDGTCTFSNSKKTGFFVLTGSTINKLKLRPVR